VDRAHIDGFSLWILPFIQQYVGIACFWNSGLPNNWLDSISHFIRWCALLYVRFFLSFFLSFFFYFNPIFLKLDGRLLCKILIS
jgi:hypothetical protein